jgi:toxin-antitoxin system PIN domain toxin
MISVDTNILFAALVEEADSHEEARGFLKKLAARRDVVISEFCLGELYRLLRNPILRTPACTAEEAVAIISHLRSHPHWRIVGFTDDSRALHDELWSQARAKGFAYRRIYDLRLALSLQRHGVKELATANLKDFQGLGFERVWNPLNE